jgi:hypothetical protein
MTGGSSYAIHCSDHQPAMFELSCKTFDSFCTLALSIRDTPKVGKDDIDIFLPSFMAPKLTRAAAAFNAEMATIEPAPMAESEQEL